ncbi:MAG: hypothetical protein IT381_31445, partial [Deltaproteobacteria bacterium]|nr:hypothetical protein [Deltaproteobacteria bacterium]
MSAAARDELLARLSFLAHLFPEKRILCVGAPEAHAEDLGNALAEHGAAEVTVSHVRAEDGTMASVSVWTDLTDVADGGIDVVIVNGAEILCDEPWYDELRRCLAPGARLVVIADNPDVMGAGQGYDDIVASVSPHFPSIELVTETRMSAQILTPYGADPEAMSLDASLASPQDARTWIFVCGEDSAALTAETVALLDEGSSVEA